MPDQPEKLNLESHDIAEDKRQEMLRLFPEIRTEGGKLDFERLKLALGEAMEVGKERYGMNWPGKADCFKTIQAPSMGTLRPCPEESVNFDSSENLIIEGDNLKVLKLLQKSYLGKVKMIYIDPPYNTGVRRVIKKLNDEDAGKLDLDGASKQDRGFRVFKLSESNFNSWNAAVPHDADALEQQLELHIDHIRDGRTADDLLFEILLKSGYPLTTPVETLSLAGKTVYSIAGGALFICLERQITLELIRAVAEAKPERVVCLDEGFAGNDQLKANAVQIFKTKGVTSFKTV
jgi:hypothetical protein